MYEQAVKCHCKKIQGYIKLAKAPSANRVVCHCYDCQAFANFLTDNNPDLEAILDACGGTDLVQVPLASVSISKGLENIACMRMTPAGPYRWYTKCCNTPIGNTLGPNIPYFGIVHSFLDDTPQIREQKIGPVKLYCQTQNALQPVTATPSHPKFSISILFRVMSRIICWRIQGLDKPSDFFNDNGEPVVQAKVLETL